MGFQKFVDNIVDLLQERMGDSYEIRVLHVTKNNDVEQTGIAITRQEDSIFPRVFIRSIGKANGLACLCRGLSTATRNSPWRLILTWIFFVITAG